MYYAESIEELKAKIQQCCADPKYERLREMWDRHRKGELVEKIPLMAETNPRTWAAALEYDPDDFSSEDTERTTRFQLERKLLEHENIHDDRVLTPDIGNRTGFEKPKQPRKNYIHATGAWLDNPKINEPGDLEKLRQSGHLHEDDVNCLLISPKHYEEFVFPYEKRIAKMYGKVSFHSCGKLTPILDLIASLPGLCRINISPWTDLEQVVEKLPKQVVLSIDMHPERDIVDASDEEITANIRNIRAIGDHRVCTVQAVSLHGVDMERIINWVNVAQPQTWRN